MNASIGQNYFLSTTSKSINSQERAVQIGRKCHFNFVIWGWFDDNGISPHVEVTEWPKDFDISMCLIKFQPMPSLPNQPDRYIKFVTNDLPKTLEYFLISVSAHISLSQSDYERAILYYTSAINLDIPEEYRQNLDILFYFRGLSNYKLGAFKQAVPDFESVIKN